MSTQKDPTGKIALVRVARVIVYVAYGFAVAASLLLAIAFFLRLFGASASAPFVEWVYRATTRVMQPFRGIFPAVEAEGDSAAVLDLSLVFGMLMYWLFSLGLHALVLYLNKKLYLLSAVGEWDEYRALEEASAPPPGSSGGPPSGSGS